MREKSLLMLMKMKIDFDLERSWLQNIRWAAVASCELLNCCFSCIQNRNNNYDSDVKSQRMLAIMQIQSWSVFALDQSCKSCLTTYGQLLQRSSKKLASENCRRVKSLPVAYILPINCIKILNSLLEIIVTSSLLASRSISVFAVHNSIVLRLYCVS